MSNDKDRGDSGDVMTKRQKAYHHIKSRIQERSLLPGQRVVAGDIAKEIGVSILPVREALFALESEGIVTITPHVGAIVTILSYEDVAGVIEPLAVLEGYVTRRALPASPRLIGDLSAANRNMEQASSDGQWGAFSAANRRFHQAIYDTCDNRRLITTMNELSAQMDALLGGSVFVLIPERVKGSIAEHSRIIRLLSDPTSKPQELENLARNHKLATQAFLEVVARPGAREKVGLTIGVFPD